MSKNNIIEIYAFDQEIGKLGLDPDRRASYFQYNPEFLNSEKYTRIFPLLIRRIKEVQLFDRYNSNTFRGLPPPFADSLPDLFGNIIFKAWLENTHKDFNQISVLEQLCYVGKRGMGALEFAPAKKIPEGTTIDLTEIIEVVNQVLENKNNVTGQGLDTTSLINIFKIGSSAGGARPKILISQDKTTGRIIPGDLVYSNDYDHYLIKLGIDKDVSYSRETIEYVYYRMAVDAGIEMMPSRMIDERHFATLRFDRVDGRKKHILTACGMRGWDFEDPQVSAYENLFDLALYLKLEQRDIDQLFRRMVFNLVFANHDDHLKNHAFIYDEISDQWRLAPAYDITYSLNPLINFTQTSRALSINGKRTSITRADVNSIAEKYTISRADSVMTGIQDLTAAWPVYAKEYSISENVVRAIQKSYWMQ
ncbi:type II toxin-antitoxin system HipA family toxin [Sediminibacterium ginsengisoli]|uniref:Serine/threonine-protein kinase HipA n=1 Tax=Sediminibacterium ginsengisoli TaxID=413434 RepID=A0A1T4K0Z5_9BACT|nr:type II toxin-antitoxin system HipA family toxin [Sediminibacterium ginsengisoli]SJZ36029.1 serine/threonine-protein kinase HipA [Sediminibacterium ginsengisoli]